MKNPLIMVGRLDMSEAICLVNGTIFIKVPLGEHHFDAEKETI